MGKRSASFSIKQQLDEQTLQEGIKKHIRVTGTKTDLSVKGEVERRDHQGRIKGRSCKSKLNWKHKQEP